MARAKPKPSQTHLSILRTPCPVVPLQHILDTLRAEIRPANLVRSPEDDTVQSVKLLKRDRRWGVPRTHPHNARLDLRRRPKVPLSDLHNVFHARKELHVRGESTPHLRPWCGCQSERKLPLKHEHGSSDDGAVREEFEDER